MTATSAADATPRNRKTRVAHAIRVGLATVLVVASGWAGIQLIVWRQGQEAQQLLAAAVAVTPEGGTIDLATAYPQHWDRAAVVGPYSIGRDANDLLGFHAFDDNQVLNADDPDSNLIFADGARVVAWIDLPNPGYKIGNVADPNWQPFAFTSAHARFTVSRAGRVATLLPQGS